MENGKEEEWGQRSSLWWSFFSKLGPGLGRSAHQGWVKRRTAISWGGAHLGRRAKERKAVRGGWGSGKGGILFGLIECETREGGRRGKKKRV